MLDESLSRLHLEFDPRWSPSAHRPRRRRVRTLPFAWKASAAALLLLGVGAASRPNVARLLLHSSAPTASASHHLVKSPWPGLAPSAIVPAYASAASAEANETTYLGRLKWQGTLTDAVVSVKTTSGTMAVGFRHSAAVWDTLNHQMQNIPPAKMLAPATGRWQAGSNKALTSFTAAGPYAYVTSGPLWAVLDGPASHWATAPGVNVVRSQIAALPSDPTHSLLLTEDAGGTQYLYVRSGLRASWTPIALPGVPVLQTVAVANEYWVLAGGVIRVWTPVGTWRTLYAPPKHFVVSTFAVSPDGSRIVVLLAPSSGASGVGPLLLSNDGGHHWTPMATPWPNGSSPTSLALEPNGAVAAFLPGPPGLVEQYSPTTGAWSILPTPTANSAGTGALTANGNGNLLYSGPAGHLYRYIQQAGAWQALPAIPGGSGGQPPNLLMGIGVNEVVASSPHGWFVFVPSAAPTKAVG